MVRRQDCHIRILCRVHGPRFKPRSNLEFLSERSPCAVSVRSHIMYITSPIKSIAYDDGQYSPK